jgi:hypothetical protein
MASISLAYECWRIGFTLLWSKVKMSKDKNVENTGETFLALTLKVGFTNGIVRI